MSALQALLRRFRDPATEQPDPLARLFLIEQDYPWPKSRDDYARALLDLAEGLRGTDAEQRCWQLRFKALCERHFGGLLMCRDEDERSARSDALKLMVSDTESLAEAVTLAAGRLSEKKRPNFLSFLQAKLIWRANDILESEIRRHARRLEPAANPFELAPFECSLSREYQRVFQRLLIQQVMAEFDGVEPNCREILTGLMEGTSIAALARKTGRSRQQIYRTLARVRTWIEQTKEAA